jgi:hypothetical protein
MLRRLGVAAVPLRADGVIRHTIMDQRIETEVFRASLPREDRAPPSGASWFRWNDFPRLPLSTVELRVAQAQSSR